MEERLQKLLSAAGVCSRRTAETYIDRRKGDGERPDRRIWASVQTRIGTRSCVDGKSPGAPGGGRVLSC